jgi:transposase
MPWKRASKIELSEKEKQILTENVKGSHTPLHLKTRSEIVLRASQGESNRKIEKEMKKDAKTVRMWRDRYNKSKEELSKIETEKPHKMRASIKTVLSDEERSGGPPKFREEQVAAIMALACENPTSRDLPFSHWTPGLLRLEVIKLGIVSDISERQVGRFLKSVRFKASSEPVLAES